MGVKLLGEEDDTGRVPGGTSERGKGGGMSRALSSLMNSPLLSHAKDWVFCWMGRHGQIIAFHDGIRDLIILEGEKKGKWTIPSRALGSQRERGRIRGGGGRGAS